MYLKMLSQSFQKKLFSILTSAFLLCFKHTKTNEISKIYISDFVPGMNNKIESMFSYTTSSVIGSASQLTSLDKLNLQTSKLRIQARVANCTELLYFLTQMNSMLESSLERQVWLPGARIDITYNVTFSKSDLLASPWSLVTNHECLSTVDKNFTSINVQTLFLMCIHERGLFEFYVLKERQVFRFLSTDCSTSTTFEEQFVPRRANLFGVPIRGVTQADDNLRLVATFHPGTPLRFKGGVAVTYFNLMASGLNFSTRAIRGTGWISQDKDGNLLGMAEQLQRGDADVLIAYSEFLPYRLRGLRFLHPYYRAEVRAFFVQPPIHKFRNVFWQPLKPDLWGALLGLWLLLIFVLKITHYIMHKGTKIKISVDRIKDLKHSKWSQDDLMANEAFIWAVASACGQGWHRVPQRCSMKLVILSGLVAFIFTYTAYSAAVVTSLSIFPTPIKSWRDLQSSNYDVFGDTLLESRSLLTNVITSMQTLSVSEALFKFIDRQPTALVSVVDIFQQAARKVNISQNQFLCNNLSTVRVDKMLVKGGMIVPANSPFRKLFNYQTVIILERGLDSRLARQYSMNISKGCIREPPSKFQIHSHVLGLSDVFSAFVILAVGVAASLLAMSLEVPYKRWKLSTLTAFKHQPYVV